MLLGDEDVKEFQALYGEEFGEPISDGEARLLATRIITLYKALAGPLRGEIAQFTDSIEGGRLDLEVGRNQADEPPASEKVVL
jgi:hypothetical protein